MKRDRKVVSNEDFVDLYEHAPCGYILTRPDGLITRANETFLEWTGFARSQLVDKRRFQDLLTVPGKIYYETHYAPLLDIQGSVNEIAFDLLGLRQEPLPVLVTTVRRKCLKGKVHRNRMTVFNASDRRKYERELLQQKRSLEKSNEEKNELLGMAAHELRTPLGVIFNYSEFLEDEAGPTLNQEHRKFISLIRTTSQYMLRLINDILDVSRIDAGKLHLDLQPTHLDELVSHSVTIHRKLAERKHICIEFSAEHGLPVLLIDQNKMAQVLDNILNNATKFSPPHTRIAVVISRTEGSLIVTVADQGQGIAPQDLETIFKPFSRVHGHAMGGEPSAGLGLSIVRRIVEGHGGRVTVESRVGQGSTFSLQLPLL